MTEMDINEAHALWLKRLADECINRIASSCNNTSNIYRACSIIQCPRLEEADLRRIIKFEDVRLER